MMTLIFLPILFFMAWKTEKNTTERIQADAVKNGVARWVADESGNPKFVWNKNISPWTETDVTKK